MFASLVRVRASEDTPLLCTIFSWELPSFLNFFFVVNINLIINPIDFYKQI